MSQPEIIEGIACYSPKFAYTNDGFHSESFEGLYKVEERNFWFKSRNRIIRFLFTKYLGVNKPKDVLEVGCGTGYVLKGLTRLKNLNLNGSEIHLEGLRYAKKRLPFINFIQLDATDIPFDKKYDAIGAFDVLEHIEEDEKVLTNIHRALKPQGYVFISVPQYKWMWSYLDDISFHKRRYSKKDLKQKLIKSGFEIIYSGSWVFSLFPLLVATRLLKKNRGEKTFSTYDAELRLNPILNSLLYAILKIDEVFIKMGVSLPFGGSLVFVARKGGRNYL